MPITRVEGYKWVLDIDSGLCIAYLVVDANGQSISKKMDWKILYQFGPPNHISLRQEIHFIAYNIK